MNAIFTDGVLPDGVTSPDAPLPVPAHVSQGVWENTKPVPGAKQKSRDGTTTDSNTDVVFDAESAQRHLDADNAESETPGMFIVISY